jgi:hypothetical protein
MLTPASARFCVLPDDMLRTIAAFVPTSELIVLVRCSRRLLSVLRGVLSRRCLDSLFVVMPYGNFGSGFGYLPCTKHLPSISALYKLQTLLGDAYETGWGSGYYFAEVPCNVGLFRMHPLKCGGGKERTVVCGPTWPALERFKSWLQRRIKQLNR